MLQSPANRSPDETGREPRCAPSVARVLHYGSCLDPGVAAKAPTFGNRHLLHLRRGATAVARHRARSWRTAGPDPLGSLVPGARHPLRAAADGVPEAEPLPRLAVPLPAHRRGRARPRRVAPRPGRAGHRLPRPLRRRGLHQHVLAVDRQQLAPVRRLPPHPVQGTRPDRHQQHRAQLAGGLRARRRRLPRRTAARQQRARGCGWPAWPVWPPTWRCAGPRSASARGVARCCSWWRCCPRR